MPTPQNTTNQQNEETPISQIVYKYLPYWPLFILFLILFGTLGYLFLHYVPPKYEADAAFIVKDQKKGSDDSKLTASLDQINTSTIIDNEIEVIQSRTLMNEVVKKLRLYAPVFEDKPLPTSAYTSSPVLIESPNPDSLNNFAKITLKYVANKGTVLLDDSVTCKMNTWEKTPYGTLRFINNPKYDGSQNQPLFFSLMLPRNAANKALANLLAFPSDKLSSVIQLSYRDQEPQLAEDVLNSLLSVYNQAALIDKSTLAKNTLAFVQGRLDIVSHDLDSIEKKIQQYKSSTGAVNLGAQGELYLQSVSANDQKLSDVSMQASVLDEVQKFVQSKDNNAAIVPSTLGVNDPVLTNLMNNLYTKQLDYENLRKTVAENNPLLVSIRDQINKIKPDILSNIESHKRGLEASKGNLAATNSSYNSVLQNIPAKEKELLEISRAQAIKQNIYSFLLQKREESALSYASFDPDSRVVDFAQASLTPVFPPKPMFIYLASIILAFIFSIGLVYARDVLNTKILYRNDLEKLATFPIIGEIAYKKTKSPIVIEEGKRTFIAEEFRKIRIALSFLGVGEKAKKVLVTSSIPGEGKSFVAVNLAIGLALTGKKVVLVDLDLNNPVLSRILNMNGDVGISNYLTDEKEPEEIIKRVELHENLFFVPPGTLPDGPAELLSNGRIKDIIAYLDNVFDFVIIDTAPVFAVTDTYLLSDFCDATLYIVRHNYTPKVLIKRLVENNKINPLVNPAIIFNGVKPRGFFNKKNGYGYGYVYDYKQKPIKSKDSSLKKKKSLV